MVIAVITGASSGLGKEYINAVIEPVSYTHLTLPTT